MTEALGRSRGRLSMKIHLVADRRCRPIARLTSPGQASTAIALGSSHCYVPSASCGAGWGPPRTRPGAVMADRAYSSKANRAYLRGRGITAVIPEKKD